VRQQFEDGGSGTNFVPLVIENDLPPTYVMNRVKAHENGGQCVTFRPQGNKIATAGSEGTVKLWNPSLNTGECKTIKVSNGPVSSLAFDNAGTMIAAGDSNSQINMIRIKPGMEVAFKLQGHQDIINTCVFTSAESGKMISVSQDRSMRIWDLNS